MGAQDLNEQELATLSVDLGGSTLRSAGTLKTGRLATQEHKRGLGRRSTVSIPSKFETVLLDPSTEADAFGARTHRFKRALTDQPGPGAYYNKPTFIRDMHNCGSVSHKGSITFASSSARFREGGPDRGTPGPGSYRSPPTTLGNGSDHRVTSTTRIFTQPTQKRHSRSSDGGGASSGGGGDLGRGVRAPGPGTYDPYQPTAEALRTARQAQSNFRSTVSRLSVAQASALSPAPGAYNVAAASETLRMQGKLVNGRLPENVVFRSRVPRDGCGVRDEAYLPHKQAKGPLGGVAGAYEKAAQLRSLVGASEIVIPRSAAVDANHARGPPVPGPGAYDATDAYHNSKLDRTMLNHSSSMFSNITLDRWGRPLKPKTSPEVMPGPGWYDVDVPIAPQQPSDAKRKTALSSAFVSGTRRLHTGATKMHAPGPAFYKPERHDRKSFLLNAQRRWI